MNKIGRIMPFILIVGIALSTAAGMLVISNIDMKTGILSHDNALLCDMLYYGAILLTAAAAAAAAGIAGRGGFGKVEGSDIAGGGAVLIGFGLLLIALCAFREAFSEMNAATPSMMLIAADFAGTAVLGIIAFVTLYKKQFKPGLGFTYVFGGFYFVTRGICCFINRMAIVGFPEYLTELLGIICAAVFFVMVGKLLSGNSGKLTKAAFCFWGAVTAAMTLSAALSTGLAKLLFSEEISDRIVLTASEAEQYFQEMHGVDAYHMAIPPLVHIAVGVFAAASTIALCCSKSHDRE